MELSRVGQYPAVQNGYTPQKGESAVPGNEKKAAGTGKDSVVFSGSADYLQSLQKQFPRMRFSVGTGFSGKTKQNTGDNANRWAFTISPKLLEKMSDDPEAEAEYTQRLRDIERATALGESLSKATGMKTVYCENYIDGNGKLYHVSISVCEDKLSEKLREETRQLREELIGRVREGNREAAGKLEDLLNKSEETGELALTDEDMGWIGVAAKTLEAPQAQGVDAAEEEAGGGDQSGVSGCVGINTAKLARMLAAAKTRSQIQAVVAKIQADLDECEAGKARGMDVDEASVQAAEQLLQEAKSQLAGAEDREATPQEEMASALASLM